MGVCCKKEFTLGITFHLLDVQLLKFVGESSIEKKDNHHHHHHSSSLRREHRTVTTFFYQSQSSAIVSSSSLDMQFFLIFDFLPFTFGLPSQGQNVWYWPVS